MSFTTSGLRIFVGGNPIEAHTTITSGAASPHPNQGSHPRAGSVEGSLYPYNDHHQSCSERSTSSICDLTQDVEARAHAAERFELGISSEAFGSFAPHKDPRGPPTHSKRVSFRAPSHIPRLMPSPMETAMRISRARSVASSFARGTPTLPVTPNPPPPAPSRPRFIHQLSTITEEPLLAPQVSYTARFVCDPLYQHSRL